MVDGGKIIHVFQEHGSFNHLGQVGSRRSKYCLEVLEYLPGLIGRIPADKLVGRGIDRQLTAGENKRAGYDRLTVRADCCRRLISIDLRLSYISFSYLCRIPFAS